MRWNDKQVDESLTSHLSEKRLTFRPMYRDPPDTMSAITVYKRHPKAAVRLKSLPEDAKILHSFCQNFWKNFSEILSEFLRNSGRISQKFWQKFWKNFSEILAEFLAEFHCAPFWTGQS